MTRRTTGLVLVLLVVVVCIGLVWRFLSPAKPRLAVPPDSALEPSTQAVSPHPPKYYELPIAQELPYPLAEQATHIHRVFLQRGQVLEVHLEQEKVDVSIDLLDPEGVWIFSVDSPNDDNGPEYAFLVAESSGEYKLVVKGNKEGSYRIRVESLRPAVEWDRINARAEEIFHRTRQCKLGNAVEVVAGFQNAADLWKENGNYKRQANALERIGDFYAKDRDWIASLYYYQLAGDLYHFLGNLSSASRMLNGQGVALKELGQWEKAEDVYTQAIELATGAVDSHAEAGGAYLNRGSLRRVNGDTLKSLADFQKSASHFHQAGTLAGKWVDALINIIHLEAQLGNTPKALRLAEEALLGSPDLKPELKAKILSHVAGVHRSEGDLRAAQTQIARALKLRSESGDARGIATSLVELGLIQRAISDLPSARRSVEEALLLYRSQGDQTGEATALVNLGMVLYDGKDFRQARDRLEESLRIAKARKLQSVQVVALYTLALIEEKLGRNDEAKQTALDALELVDSTDQEKRVDELEQLYLEAREGINDLLISLSASPKVEHTSDKDLRFIFEVLEKGRRRRMREGMGEVRLKVSPGMISPELHVRRNSLVTHLDQLRKEEWKLRREGQPRGSLEEDIKQAIEELETLDTEIRESHPWYPFVELPKPVTLLEALELLDDDTVLVVYELMESRSLALVMTRSWQEIFELPPRREIEDLVKVYLEYLSEGPTPDNRHHVNRVGQQLSRILLGPFAHRLGASTLAIVPDGLIHDVAFAALPRPGSSDLLIEQNLVVILPSVSVLKASRAVVANRKPSEGTLALFAVAKFVDLPSLEFTEVEAAKILARMGDKEPPPLSVIGQQATRRAAKSGIWSHHKVIHLATHAESHRTHPGLSRIVFSDGDLTAREIQEMDIRADLVVLSACEAAREVDFDSEGQFGLSHSFIYAGAPRVVASLWRVNDRAASIFMERFYDEMYGDGDNVNLDQAPAEALRATQEWMSQQEKWSAPYYWAGFQLIGDWR